MRMSAAEKAFLKEIEGCDELVKTFPKTYADSLKHFEEWFAKSYRSVGSRVIRRASDGFQVLAYAQPGTTYYGYLVNNGWK